MISWFLDSDVFSRSKLALLRSVLEPEAIRLWRPSRIPPSLAQSCIGRLGELHRKIE
jgi:hypothetical protein